MDSREIQYRALQTTIIDFCAPNLAIFPPHVFVSMNNIKKLHTQVGAFVFTTTHTFIYSVSTSIAAN